MAVTGTLGARLYVSADPLANIDAAADAIGDFQGLTIDTELGLIENLGEFGRQFNIATFVSVAEGRTRKLKADYNDGQLQLTVGQDLSDAGQAAMKAYADASNQNTYPFKIVINGAPASYDTVYFGAVVTQFRTQMGAAGAVVKAMLTLEINTTIFTGAN